MYGKAITLEVRESPTVNQVVGSEFFRSLATSKACVLVLNCLAVTTKVAELLTGFVG